MALIFLLQLFFRMFILLFFRISSDFFSSPVGLFAMSETVQQLEEIPEQCYGWMNNYGEEWTKINAALFMYVRFGDNSGPFRSSADYVMKPTYNSKRLSRNASMVS